MIAALFTFLSLGQVTAISGPTTVEPYRQVRLEAVGTADQIFWDCHPYDRADIAVDTGPALAFTGPPGGYDVSCVGLQTGPDGKPLITRVRTHVTISGTPTPNPGPGPRPAPDPTPTPAPPGPGPSPTPAPTTEVARAAQSYARDLIISYAQGWQRSGKDLGSGLSASVAMTNGSAVIREGRDKALQTQLYPMLMAGLPQGTEPANATERAKVANLWLELANELGAIGNSLAPATSRFAPNPVPRPSGPRDRAREHDWARREDFIKTYARVLLP